MLVLPVVVAVVLAGGVADGGAPSKRLDVLWGRFSLELEATSSGKYVHDPTLLQADGLPTDERVWLEVPSGADAPTFVLAATEEFVTTGKAGLTANQRSIFRLVDVEKTVVRSSPRQGACGGTACIEYDGVGTHGRHVVGYLVAVDGEVLTLDFLAFRVEGDLSAYRERARVIMRSFQPGRRALRPGDRASAPDGGCCGNVRLTFPTPPGFVFTARMSPQLKVFRVSELLDPEAPKAEPITIHWLAGDASTSPSGKQVAGRLWGTPVKWKVEEDGTLSIGFWDFQFDTRHNQLVVSGLRTRKKQTQPLVDGIDWDGIEAFREAQRAGPR